jgi:hypothetical protein
MGIDRDEDDLPNGVETGTGVFIDGDDTGTNPALSDTDGDGFDDGIEVLAGTDPNNPFDFPSSSVPSMSGRNVGLLCSLLLVAGWFGLRRRNA